MREYDVLCRGCNKTFKVSGSTKMGTQMKHTCGFEGIVSWDDKGLKFHLYKP
jgi:hypothetical protein